MTPQDFQIISALISDGTKSGMTAYSISTETKISQTQVSFRLDKLIDNGVVTESKTGKKTLYYAHDVFYDKKAMELIAEYIELIVETIYGIGEIHQDGIKIVMGYISSGIEISDETDDSEESRLIIDFVNMIEKFADNRGYIISDIKSWTQPKIKWMALNDGKCGCDPENRRCPCKECKEEVENTGSCLCSIFMRG